MTVDELPKLTVTALTDGHCVATFDPAPRTGETWVGENWIGCVHVEGTFVWGRFSSVDAGSRRCRFRPDTLDDLVRFQIGQAYPYLDGYWGERAELVLTDQPWQRARFEPRDAVRFTTPEGVLMTEADRSWEGGERVPGGWDHAHCEICTEKLGAGGQPHGFLSPPRTWVCERCYRQFVARRSLGFLRDL
jgi:hypothetical protein